MKGCHVTEAERLAARKLVGMYGLRSGNEDEVIDQVTADIHKELATEKTSPDRNG